MRKLFAFLARPIVWSTGALLLLLLALHVVCPLLGVQDEQRWIIELLVGIPLTVLLLGYWLRLFLIERRLASDMAAQAKKQAALQGPDALRDYKAFSEEFTRAFAQLNQTCRERGQLGGASALPWIMILGPSGVGKSTALERSGLRFVSLGRRLQGIGGTRNCTWWLASDAVFLDTAGRYAVRDEDRDEWRAFLQLLRRRRVRPIDAVLLQVGIDEILDRPRAEVERAALQLRERLDELLLFLDAQIPIQLLFNKCDLLDGFVPFFAALDEQEKARPWGFRLDTNQLSSQSLGESFQRSFAELVRVITQRLTARLLAMTDRESREAALSFPAELAQAAATLRFFVETLFEVRSRSAHRETPWLCAVHFGSAEQTGQHQSSLRQRRSEELGLPSVRQSASLMPMGTGNSGETLFLRGVFSQILRQAELSARPSLAKQSRMRLHQKLALATGGALCLLGSYYLGSRYTESLRWMTELQQQTTAMHSAESVNRDASQVKRDEIIAELHRQEQVRLLLEDAPSGVPHGPAQEASALLRHRIEKEWLLPLHGQLQEDLQRAAGLSGGAAGEEFSRGFHALRLLYVLGGNSCAGTDPEPTRESLSHFVWKQWQRAIKEQGRFLEVESSDEQDPQRPRSPSLRLRREVEFYFAQEPALIGKTSTLRFEESLRQEAKRTLASGADDSVVFNLRTSLSSLYEREPQFRSEKALLTDKGIKRVFTERGCSEFFSKEASRDREWWKCVLDVPVPKDPPNLEELYRSKYVEAWNGWLRDLQLRPSDPANSAKSAMGIRKETAALEEVLRKLDGLIRDTPPALPEVWELTGRGRPNAAAAGGLRRGKRPFYAGCSKQLDSLVAQSKNAARQINTPRECRDAMALLAPLTQLTAKDKAPASDGTEASDTSPQEDYKRYVTVVKSLRKRLVEIAKSTKRNAEALALLQETMASKGELWNLQSARDELIHNLHDRLKGSGFDLESSGLQVALRSLEEMTWKALLPPAALALNEQWRAQVYALWKTTKENQERQRTTDDEKCKARTDLLRGKLKDFVDKSLTMFKQENNVPDCNPRRLDPPFDDAIPILSSACSKIAYARRVGEELTDCPKALAGGGGLTKRDPQLADMVQPKTKGCEAVPEFVVLDRADKVFLCNQSSERCTESQIKTSQRGRLMVKWQGLAGYSPILEYDSADELYRQGHLTSGKLVFRVPERVAPGKCRDYVIRFTLAPSSAGGGEMPKAPDDRWRNVELPESLLGNQH